MRCSINNLIMMRRALFTKTALSFAMGFLLGSLLVLYRQRLYEPLRYSTVLTSRFSAVAAPYTSQERLSSGSATLPSASSTPQALPLREITAAMVVLIFSTPLGAGRRHGIRETWLRDAAALNVTAKFLVGTAGLSPEEVGALTAERERFNDMALLPDLKESFLNLTLKLLKGVVWAYEHVNFEYFMKTDDDLYIRLDQAVAAIHNMKPEYRGRIYWGYFGAAAPTRFGKYAEPKWVLKCPNYFPYAYGASYIVAQSALSLVARLSAKFYTGYLCEDTSMGSWLAPFDLVRIHDLRFTFNMSKPACKVDYIASHLHNPASLHSEYRKLQNGNETLCRNESTGHVRWVFNWEFPQENCCRKVWNIQREALNVTVSAFARDNRQLWPFYDTQTSDGKPPLLT